ncbi:hypothetical protein SH139x_003445 [Planctomycetaceae bacterium SH139]
MLSNKQLRRTRLACKSRLANWSLIATLLIGCCGCSPAGPARQAVSGTVSLDGKAATDIKLVFIPLGGNQVGAVADVENGQFQLSAEHGPSAGAYDVVVETVQPELEDFESLRQAGETPFSTTKIANKYLKRGELRADVQADGANAFTFEITSR